MSDMPLVSVILPCRNEGEFVAQCLESIIGNDYPGDKFEILVVDGQSDDDTRGIVERYAQQYSFIKLIENPRVIFPSAINLGYQNSKGAVIAIVGAHTRYSSDYISQCIKHMMEYGADNVGAGIRIIPSSDGILAKAISLALMSRFGSGNADYKVQRSYEPRWVDTVFGGCYKREVFDRIGMFNEQLARSSDSDFNIRLGRAGGHTLLIPGIVTDYYIKGTFLTHCRRNFSDGFWVIIPLRFGSRAFSWRHLVPLAFVSNLITAAILSLFLPMFVWILMIVAGSYIAVVTGFTIKIAAGQRNSKLLYALPLIFMARHFAYGLGSVYGAVKLLIESTPRLRKRIS